MLEPIENTVETNGGVKKQKALRINCNFWTGDVFVIFRLHDIHNTHKYNLIWNNKKKNYLLIEYYYSI